MVVPRTSPSPSNSEIDFCKFDHVNTTHLHVFLHSITHSQSSNMSSSRPKIPPSMRFSLSQLRLLPLTAGAVWITTLLTLLIYWLASNRPRYPSQSNPYVAYASLFLPLPQNINKQTVPLTNIYKMKQLHLRHRRLPSATAFHNRRHPNLPLPPPHHPIHPPPLPQPLPPLLLHLLLLPPPPHLLPHILTPTTQNPPLHLRNPLRTSRMSVPDRPHSLRQPRPPARASITALPRAGGNGYKCRLH